MAEQAQQTDLEEAPAQEPQGGDEGGTDWKHSSRKWEQRAKENKAEADAAKDEAKRLKEEKERESLVKATSKATGVPAEVLRGTTKEEIEAHAESLKSYFAKPTAPQLDLGKPSASERPSEKVEFARKLFGRE